MSEANGTSAAAKALVALDLLRAGTPIREAAVAAGCGDSKPVYMLQRVLKKNPNLEQPLRDGKLTLYAAAVASGARDDGKIANPTLFGRGDRFIEAVKPLDQWLRSWSRKNYEFVHLNPTEAAKRLKQIDRLITGLTEARTDIERRAHKATLTAPSNRKGENK